MEIKINTKFNIGDEVYYIKGGKVCLAQVCHIHASYIIDGAETAFNTYRLKSPLSGERFLEDFVEKRLFATKEELLKHIGK